jgi:EAL domain-containing protein (putative c-di-GMP-specific phosphodiesterase class I)
LKIDRSFVRGLPGDESDAGIVNAIVNLGHALHMQIVAEGVETEAQRVFLQSLGCGQYQGFLFAPALDALTFDARLASHAAQHPSGSSSTHVRLVHG